MIKVLVMLGALVMLVGSAGYIVDTIRGKTQPNRVTWLIWAVAIFTTTAAELSDGVTWSVLPVFMEGLCPFLIFLTSFFNKKAYWKLGKLDYGCGVFAILALILWMLTDNPVIAVLFALLSDVLAAVPTLIKSWRHPESESKLVYVLSVFSALTAIVAIRSWSFVESAFPFYLFALNFVCVLILFRKRAR